MERWKFEKLEVEGCGIVATPETDEEREQVDKDVERLGKVLPFLGLELLEEGTREATRNLQHRETEIERERREKERMMREVEKELELRGNRLAQGG